MRTAIVTGAGSGIGRATALRLAAIGYAVALAGRTQSSLEKVAAEIGAVDGKATSQALVVPADVSKSSDLEVLVNTVMAEWGRIDVLVNNAGMAPSIPLHEMAEVQWHAVLDANLSSVFHATRLVWPIMSRQRSGVIVNISSMAAKDPFPGLGAYAVAKAGVNMLTLVLAREGNAVGIRVVGIAPAGVDTPMFRALVGEKNVNTNEILRPEDVAAAIAQIVDGGDAALRYASGDTIYLHRRPA